jgi:hypothetical protein
MLTRDTSPRGDNERGHAEAVTGWVLSRRAAEALATYLGHRLALRSHAKDLVMDDWSAVVIVIVSFIQGD